jgi:lysozyme
MNGPSGVPAVPSLPATIATAPTIQPTIKTYLAPTADEIVNCKDPTNTFDTLSDMTVPQHQPWPEACELSIGFSGFVDISSTEETRQGAARVDALTPITKIQASGVFQGNPYATSTTGEAPTFTKIRDIEPGELNPCSSYTTSDKGIDFLQRHEGFKTKAYRDADGFSIGFGHFLTAGDQITGVLNGQDLSRPLTTEDIRTIRRTEGALVITDSEARRIFREDLVRFEQAVCDSVTIEITQGQFDGMVSFAYNVGPGNLSKMIASSGLNSGDFTAVPSSWMKYSKCPRCIGNRGRVEAVLARRRREELEQLFSAVA